MTLAGPLGCSKKTPEPTSDTPLPPSSGPGPVQAAPTAQSATPPVEIAWQDPPSFRRVPPKNAMRKASYEVPHAPGDTEDGELAVFYFGPGQGGSIDANVDRWVKQFSGVAQSDVKRADRVLKSGLRLHTVEIVHGTFESGMPGTSGGPKKEYGLEGAIVEAPSGAYFFKMTGPTKTVAAARTAFNEMLDGVHAGG